MDQPQIFRQYRQGKRQLVGITYNQVCGMSQKLRWQIQGGALMTFIMHTF